MEASLLGRETRSGVGFGRRWVVGRVGLQFSLPRDGRKWVIFCTMEGKENAEKSVGGELVRGKGG